MGQNFMLDDSVLTAIVDAAGVGPGDLVLEIGPGGCWVGEGGLFVARGVAAVLPRCSGALPYLCTVSNPPASPSTGTGNLTRHLLAAGALVTAVEKDEALSAQLAKEFAEVRQGVPAVLSVPRCPAVESLADFTARRRAHACLPAARACPPCRCPSCAW